jgi:transcriptional regulator with GAF, ATPase, and Fis domain
MPISASGVVLSPAAREAFRSAGLVGESPVLLRCLAQAERAAAFRATICIEGETGTGKELLARAIHRLGPRAGQTFLAQNCAALADGLLDSELFGHARGAFTGALAARRGLFEIASGGTLFLDEISETSAATQAKLLRVLQEGEVRPLGGERSRRVDVRVIAASNRDLRSEVTRGRFRADLYHRLTILPLRLPPLRERTGDVAILVGHYLAALGGGRHRLEPAALAALERYPWPGNVRELRNEIERLLIYSDGAETVSVACVAEHVRAGAESPPDPRPLREIVRAVELETIAARLRENGYCRTTTARSLGITREALWSKMRRLGYSAPRRASGSQPPEQGRQGAFPSRLSTRRNRLLR